MIVLTYSRERTKEKRVTKFSSKRNFLEVDMRLRSSCSTESYLYDPGSIFVDQSAKVTQMSNAAYWLRKIELYCSNNTRLNNWTLVLVVLLIQQQR